MPRSTIFLQEGAQQTIMGYIFLQGTIVPSTTIYQRVAAQQAMQALSLLGQYQAIMFPSIALRHRGVQQIMEYIFLSVISTTLAATTYQPMVHQLPITASI